MPMPRILRLCRGRARGKKEDTTDDRRGTKEGKAAEKLGTEVVVPRGTRSPTRRGYLHGYIGRRGGVVTSDWVMGVTDGDLYGAVFPWRIVMNKRPGGSNTQLLCYKGRG